MLNPKKDTIDYGEQLIPPSGYELDYAIGTTYSLDLEALMIIPVSLFYSQRIEGTINELRYDMLDAISKASEKIVIYYQNGQLKVPQKYHNLMSFWEKGIEKVTMPNHLSSFHPKTWIIRFEKKDSKARYRVLVTSRNLTFARDWDVAFVTEGEVTTETQSANTPLVNFLHYLNSKGRRKIPSKFLQELIKVKFDIPEKFSSLNFVPIGIPDVGSEKKYNNPITSIRWDELLIVSPFLDKDTLEKVKCVRSNPFLLSRKEELDIIDENTLNKYKCWQFSNFFEQAEFFEELEDGSGQPMAQNLHAKMYVGMNDNNIFWYLGSANCSAPAQERNIEFLIQLNAKNLPGLRTDDIRKMLTEPSKGNNIILFSEYIRHSPILDDEKKNIESEIRKLKYELTLLDIIGEIKQITGGTAYDLSIYIDATKLAIPKGYMVTLKPLPEQQKTPYLIIQGTENQIEKFGGYPETALSIFLVFEIIKDSNIFSQFLLPMNIELPQSRLNRIFTSIINNREHFLKYLAFLLTGEETALINSMDQSNNGSSVEEYNQYSFLGTPVYEKLLVASSRFPQKLESVNNLVQRLKEEDVESKEPIISQEFEDFWNVFQTFINKKNNGPKN